ncbi:MAG TPA: glycogen/starch synthase [Planctomycetota bacterium]|nr:glycogen/starch synthase [Planctomycetota bacterium]
MRVAFVTPELLSLVRRTSLAEVAECLPLALRQRNVDARVFLPYSSDIAPEAIADLRSVGEVEVVAGSDSKGTKNCTLEVFTGLSGTLPVVLFSEPKLFRSRHPYGDESGPYDNNWLRFSVFARGVLESFKLLGFTPAVIHCLDWTAGLIPLIHQLEYKDREGCPAAKAGTYFAAHNLAMQGAFEREILPHIDIPHRWFRGTEGIELHGRVNYLKAGIEFATVIGTHSPSHALEIQEQDRGYGLEDVFARRKKELVGITNGIDYRAWDPATDQLLAQPFDKADKELNWRRKCKAMLQQNLTLDNGPRTPIVALIGRFDTDNGFDLFIQALTPILERNLELVLMGTGPPEVIERLRTIEETFAGRCRLIDGYHVNIAHTILAGADILLMPAHHHPSNALCAIAMRYGCVPLLYAQSGLQDIAIDAASSPKKGTGFTFARHNVESFLEGLDNARALYKKASDWKTMVRRCLALDFSWQTTAEDYIKAYRRVTRRIKGR